VTELDDPVKEYTRAERRLRELLFGDGAVTVGIVKGEERRLQTTRLLRRMAAAVSELAGEEDRAARAEARAADLEEELRKLAAARTGDRPQRS
jgi:hypothetical protein